MDRRTVLAGTGTALSLLLAGCSNGIDANDEFDPDVEPVERVGGAPPVSIEAEPEREYEYRPGSDSVRVEFDGGETATMPFDEWGTRRATDHAVDHVYSLLAEQSLAGTGVSVGQGEAVLSELDRTTAEDAPSAPELDRDAQFAPVVFHEHRYDRNGDLVSEPSVSFDAIVEATPRTVDVTVLFPEREYAATLPVVCQRTVVRYS
ncbi:hypothetical protein [Halomicrococcus gelatinilyticus]|uniref:hypothetical protein n=1 Tax=Halomicrococcus gelatinilyticus TaxID=1702103 RepID=UPI002E0EE91E